jgi:hypothetical protein
MHLKVLELLKPCTHSTMLVPSSGRLNPAVFNSYCCWHPFVSKKKIVVSNQYQKFVKNSGPIFRRFSQTITFVTSARPSVRTEQLGYHWTDFHGVRYVQNVLI